jgi:subtilisin family serine protease
MIAIRERAAAMTRRVSLLLLWIVLGLSSAPAAAQNQLIVRDSLGLTGLRFTCVLLGCSVTEGIDGPLGQVFLITTNRVVSETQFLATLLAQAGVVDAEPNLTLRVTGNLGAPSALWDVTPVDYYGTTAWHGYVHQPAATLVRLQDAHDEFGVTGSGVVAVIDTGVDPTHPVLQSVLLQGYDFTRNRQRGSELGDVNQSSMAVMDGAYPAQVNQSSMAVMDQEGIDYISQSQYADFGHGTMVAGIVHLVAPTTAILPLKAFRADGTGYLSDVLRAVYYAAHHDANVVNMSFDFPTFSQELKRAIDYAKDRGVVAVASAGNGAEHVVVYPAGLGNVIGVASTSNDDTLSSFSNYGQPPVWVGAPGEGVVTTYPFGTYAAGWGTSFSAPLVAGTVALLRDVGPNVEQRSAARAIADAETVSCSADKACGYGRLDVYRAVAASASRVSQ